MPTPIIALLIFAAFCLVMAGPVIWLDRPWRLQVPHVVFKQIEDALNQRAGPIARG